MSATQHRQGRLTFALRGLGLCGRWMIINAVWRCGFLGRKQCWAAEILRVAQGWVTKCAEQWKLPLGVLGLFLSCRTPCGIPWIAVLLQILWSLLRVLCLLLLLYMIFLRLCIESLVWCNCRYKGTPEAFGLAFPRWHSACVHHSIHWLPKPSPDSQPPDLITLLRCFLMTGPRKKFALQMSPLSLLQTEFFVQSN